MTGTSSADDTRRANWANRENQRRQAQYQKSMAAWTKDAQLVDWMLATANAPQSATPYGPSSGFRLKRGEALVATFQGCRLIEPKRGAAHFVGGHSGFSFTVARGVRYSVGGSRGTFIPGAEELKIVDLGDVVVTNKRIAFQGGFNSREWSFSKLIGLNHDTSRAITYLHVSNRQKVSALAYPVAEAAIFRFSTELGAAQESGATAALIGTLTAERAELTQRRPVSPGIATPAEAPTRGAAVAQTVTAIMTGKPSHSAGRRLVHTLVATSAALLVFGVGASALANPHSSGGSVVDTATAPTPSSVAGSPPGPTAPTPSAISGTPTLSEASTPGSASPTSTPTISPSLPADEAVGAFPTGSKPKPPKLLKTTAAKQRVGAICRDGSWSDATGSGACSHHDGVRKWVYELPYWVSENKATNAERTKKYKAALKAWNEANKKNALLKKYPCSGSPYPRSSPGYAAWRDTNGDGVVVCS